MVLVVLSTALLSSGTVSNFFCTKSVGKGVTLVIGSGLGLGPVFIGIKVAVQISASAPPTAGPLLEDAFNASQVVRYFVRLWISIDGLAKKSLKLCF